MQVHRVSKVKHRKLMNPVMAGEPRVTPTETGTHFNNVYGSYVGGGFRHR